MTETISALIVFLIAAWLAHYLAAKKFGPLAG